MTKRNIGIFNNNWKGGHRRDIVEGEKLTPAEENAALLDLAKQMLHSELSWCAYYTQKNQMDNARRSLDQAWGWYLRGVELETIKPEDLGTHVIVSGGEVLELDAHLESQYGDQFEYPF